MNAVTSHGHSPSIALATLAVVAVLMLVENRRSARHERALRARGAVEPSDDVYRVMQVVYPGCFVGMAAEGIATGVASSAWLVAGVGVLIAAKILKYWAIASLGDRWTFRVLVPADGSLVRLGPYRWMAHPNYLAVLGEIAGVAVMMGAPISGAVSLLWFGRLLARRIVVENRALGL